MNSVSKMIPNHSHWVVVNDSESFLAYFYPLRSVQHCHHAAVREDGDGEMSQMVGLAPLGAEVVALLFVEAVGVELGLCLIHL